MFCEQTNNSNWVILTRYARNHKRSLTTYHVEHTNKELKLFRKIPSRSLKQTVSCRPTDILDIER